MPAEYLAKFKLPIGNATVETTADGYKVIRHCRILEAGGTARVALQDGSVIKIERTAELSKKLLALADEQGGVVDCHFTHDWVEDTKDPLHYDSGFWSDMGVEDDGTLFGDLNLSPSPYQDKIVFIAQKNPRAGMVSAIFKFHAYERDGKTYAEPFEFRSADIVRKGEATTALLSAVKQTQTNANQMTKEEITAFVSSPEFTAALSAANKPLVDKIETLEKSMPKPIEASAILSEVKKGITEATPEILKQAEAAAVAKIGDARLSSRDGGNEGAETPEKEAEAAIAQQLTAGASSRDVAIARLAQDKPKIYNFIREKGIV